MGGDKPLPYLDLGKEENPFLGWRGIRFCLDKPEIFIPQLRAILQASLLADGSPANVKLMFPMIGTLTELRRAKAMVQQAREHRITSYNVCYTKLLRSLIELPVTMSFWDVPAETRASLGIGDSLVRLACGIENAEDLIADMQQALDRV